MARGSQATRPARPRGRHAPGEAATPAAARSRSDCARARRRGTSSRIRTCRRRCCSACSCSCTCGRRWSAASCCRRSRSCTASTPWTPFVPDDVGELPQPAADGRAHGRLPVALPDPRRCSTKGRSRRGTRTSSAASRSSSNPQTGLFSLFSLPLWILPLNYGIGVGAALKLWAAGFGSYLLVRELRLGFLPALLAGVCFSFSAINIVWLTHETLPAVAALLPWMLWLVERIYERRPARARCSGWRSRPRSALGGGHPGMQVHLLAAAGAVRAAAGGVPAARTPRRASGCARSALAVGGLALGVAADGRHAAARGAVEPRHGRHGRAQPRRSGTLPGTQMPLTTIRTVAVPGLVGAAERLEAAARRPARAGPSCRQLQRAHVLRGRGRAAARARSASPRAGAGGARRRSSCSAVLGLAIPLHAAGPLPARRRTCRCSTRCRTSGCTSCGRWRWRCWRRSGCRRCSTRPAGDRRRLARGVGALVLGVVALLARARPATGASATRVTHFVTGTDFQRDRGRGAHERRLVPAVRASACGARCWRRGAGRSARSRSPRASCCWRRSTCCTSRIGYQPMAPASKAIPPRTTAIALLQRHRDEGRIVGLGKRAPQRLVARRTGCDDVRGYDPPQPSTRYLRPVAEAEPEQLDWVSVPDRRAHAGGAAGGERARGALRGRRPGLAARRREGGEAGGGSLHGLRVAYDGIDARVFSNARAAPRAIVAPRVRVVAGEDRGAGGAGRRRASTRAARPSWSGVPRERMRWARWRSAAAGATSSRARVGDRRVQRLRRRFTPSLTRPGPGGAERQPGARLERAGRRPRRRAGARERRDARRGRAAPARTRWSGATACPGCGRGAL